MEQHEQFQVLVKPVTAGGANALVFTGSFSKVSQLSRSYGKRKKSPFLGNYPGKRFCTRQSKCAHL